MSRKPLKNRVSNQNGVTKSTRHSVEKQEKPNMVDNFMKTRKKNASESEGEETDQDHNSSEDQPPRKEKMTDRSIREMNDAEIHEQEEEEEIQESIVLDRQENRQLNIGLSKCWAKKSAHVPSYSGGKVTLCNGRGMSHLYGMIHPNEEEDIISHQKQTIPSRNNNKNNKIETTTLATKNNEESSSSSTTVTPFFLAPCFGDLSIIDATKGIQARTIRRGCIESSTFLPASHQKKNEEEEEVDDEDINVDADAIVCYTLAPNDIDLITASRNNILRQYNLSGHFTQSHNYENKKMMNHNDKDALTAPYQEEKGPAKVVRTLGKSGHDLPITHMEFHRSGIFFATGSVDGKVKVWDLRGGYITHSFHHNNSNAAGGGLRGSVTSLTWCPEISKLWIAIGRDDASIKIHDLRDEQKHVQNMAHLLDHVSAVTSMAWVTPDLDLFLSAGRDAVINIWSITVQQQSLLSQSEKDKAEVRSDHLAHLSQRRNKKDVKRSRKEDSDIRSEKDAVVQYIYKRIFTLPIYEQVEAMVLLPNFYQYTPDITKRDVVFATAGSKGIVRVWKTIRDDSEHHQFGAIKDIVLVRQQTSLSSFGEKRGGYMGLLLASHKQRLLPSVSAVGGIFEELVAIDAEHNFSFLSLDSSSALSLHRTIVGHNDEILDLKIIPESLDIAEENRTSMTSIDENVSNNRRIIVATNSAQVRIFELGSYSCNTLDGHTDTVLSVDVSPCGRFFATCGKDKTMRLWHAAKWSCVAIATGHTEAIGATAMSRKIGRYEISGKAAKSGSGAFIVTASNDKTIKRWNFPGATVLISCEKTEAANPATESTVFELSTYASTKGHDKDINVVSIAPNDSLIATGSQDKTVKLWNPDDLSLMGTLKGHKRGVWDCQFSPHDRVIATSSGDKTVKLWSLGDYSCVRTFQGHLSSVLRVRFLNGGLQLVSSGSDGLVKLWTIRSNECESTMDGHADKVWAMDLSPDGSLLVTGGADSKLVVWTDITQIMEDMKKKDEETNVLLEQKLANHLRFKEFEKALEIALDMDKPMQALKIFLALVETDISKGSDPSTTLRRHVQSWSMDRLTQILRYCRDWNTRARNSHIAMLLVHAVVSVVPVSVLANAEGIPEILAGIIPYAERHFERIDKLHSNSFLIDYVLYSMGTLFGNEYQQDGDMHLEKEYSKWAAESKFVLPPKTTDGRVQVGGGIVIGMKDSKLIGLRSIMGDDDGMSTEDATVETLSVESSDDDDSVSTSGGESDDSVHRNTE